MKNLLKNHMRVAAGLALLTSLAPLVSQAADHNDPNSINSIFSDIKPDPADLYDLFGWPSDDVSGGEKVIVALTFASAPSTGVFDTDMLYRILLAPTPRVTSGLKDDETFTGMLKYFRALEEQYVGLKPSEIRVTVGADQRAKVDFGGFTVGPGGTFSTMLDLNTVSRINTPNGYVIKAFICGRVVSSFNAVPGLFLYDSSVLLVCYFSGFFDNKGELKVCKSLSEVEGEILFLLVPL